MKAWRTPALTGYSCEDFSSRTTYSLYINEKRRNKAIYLISNYVRLRLVGKASIPLSKAMDILSVTVLEGPDLLKALAVLSDTTFRRSAVDR